MGQFPGTGWRGAVLLLIIFLSHLSFGATAVRVMSFNVWMGGDNAGPLQRTVDTIKAVDPDLVGVQEADENGAEIARRLGYFWYPVAEGVRRGGILSRYPASRTFDQGIEVAFPGGEKAVFFSAHLRSDPYEPYDLRDKILKSSADAVSSAKRSRGEQIENILAEMRSVESAGQAAFLVGDFNEPSHLDWTQAAGPKGAGLHRWVVPWPTSLSVVEAGYRDAYRTYFPDETKKPGYTWTPLFYFRDIHDRIDFIYYRGDGVRVDRVRIAGEKEGPDVEIPFSVYPSDHRAVVGDFTLP